MVRPFEKPHRRLPRRPSVQSPVEKSPRLARSCARPEIDSKDSLGLSRLMAEIVQRLKRSREATRSETDCESYGWLPLGSCQNLRICGEHRLRYCINLESR